MAGRQGAGTSGAAGMGWPQLLLLLQLLPCMALTLVPVVGPAVVGHGSTWRAKRRRPPELAARNAGGCAHITRHSHIRDNNSSRSSSRS